MKILTLISLFTLTTFFANAQNCYRTGTFVGAGDVDVKGSVTLEVQDDGSINLTLSSDFVSDAGPDLDIYLGSTDRVDGFSIRMEALGSLSGGQTYTLSSGIELVDYSYISIHCTQYNHHYGAAMLGSTLGNCSTLKVNDASAPLGLNIKMNKSGVSVVSDKVYQSVSFALYDFSGKLLRSEVLAEINKGETKLHGDFSATGIVVLTGKNWVLRRKYIIK